MGCGSNSKCLLTAKAIELIVRKEPTHLILVGSCCSVKALVAKATKITIVADAVEQLLPLAQVAPENVELVASDFSYPPKVNEADLIYINFVGHVLPARAARTLAGLLRPGGRMLLSFRTYSGEIADWLTLSRFGIGEGMKLDSWQHRLARLGLTGLQELESVSLARCYDHNGCCLGEVRETLLMGVKPGSPLLG